MSIFGDVANDKAEQRAPSQFADDHNSDAAHERSESIEELSP